MQPTVIDEVRTGTYRQLFHPGEPLQCTAMLCCFCELPPVYASTNTY